jgi:ubiquinone/menaquinone biosynthesis C-methylase UbiE
MMSGEPQEIVESAYDAIAEVYLQNFTGEAASAARMRYIGNLSELLGPDSAVLKLGCGAGVPVTAALAQRFDVTGIDISAAQLTLARERVPSALFVKADMTSVEFPAASFDAVVACYSFIHLPKGSQPGMLSAIARWLRPGGYLLVSFGIGGRPSGVEQWHGVPIYVSGHTVPTNRRHLADAGFVSLIDRVDIDTEQWHWVLARSGDDLGQPSLRNK